MLVNLKDTPLTGKEGEGALEHVGITVNKNTVPFRDAKPVHHQRDPHRNAAVTTRGMKERRWNGSAT